MAYRRPRHLMATVRAPPAWAWTPQCGPNAIYPWSVSFLSADGVDVCGNRLRLIRRQLSAAHRGHCTTYLFWLGYALGDRLLDPAETAITPQPCTARQVSPNRRATPSGAMTSSASAIGCFAVINAIPERHLFRSRSSGRRTFRRCLPSSISVHALWWRF